jgi:hypothetical protein
MYKALIVLALFICSCIPIPIKTTEYTPAAVMACKQYCKSTFRLSHRNKTTYFCECFSESGKDLVFRKAVVVSKDGAIYK